MQPENSEDYYERNYDIIIMELSRYWLMKIILKLLLSY